MLDYYGILQNNEQSETKNKYCYRDINYSVVRKKLF